MLLAVRRVPFRAECFVQASVNSTDGLFFLGGNFFDNLLSAQSNLFFGDG